MNHGKARMTNLKMETKTMRVVFWQVITPPSYGFLLYVSVRVRERREGSSFLKGGWNNSWWRKDECDNISTCWKLKCLLIVSQWQIHPLKLWFSTGFTRQYFLTSITSFILKADKYMYNAILTMHEYLQLIVFYTALFPDRSL